ncbi:alpha/beta hydrolase [Methylocapsa sp. S129]|uniref:alpha/beta hydrolase n=1 Tax=Methylocapsa sp. S129 TaxID=1641869 RepID=UPI001FEF8121|nr:alpha/beta hydrolase [Methylocapsa sp. S129]
MTKAFPLAAAAIVVFTLMGCASRPSGNLIAVSASAPGASSVDMLVATTRSDDAAPAGVMFGGERGHGLSFADIAISIPPDAARKIGEVQWPSTIPGDAAHDFVTLRADRLDLKQATAAFDNRLHASPTRHVLLFVHGYNTRFEEAVYRFAQIAHDAGAPVVPVLFTWPSRGKLFDYAYDRESATYSRDALEAVLQGMVKDANVASISILAHSMGNFVAIEAIRQMAIRNRALSPKIKDIMLAAPDIDVDVFRRDVAEIEASARSVPITLFVSQDDHALDLSRKFAGGEPRLGAVDPGAEPYRSMLAKAHVDVVDLTALSSDDPLNHGKFSQSEVVKAIGLRLASGQRLNDSKQTLGERLGGVVEGATDTVGKAAVLAVSAPVSIFDSGTRETLKDQAASLGATAGRAIQLPADTLAQ